MPIMWSLLITVGTPPWIQSLTPTAIYLIYLIYRRRIFVENIKVKKNVLLVYLKYLSPTLGTRHRPTSNAEGKLYLESENTILHWQWQSL